MKRVIVSLTAILLCIFLTNIAFGGITAMTVNENYPDIMWTAYLPPPVTNLDQQNSGSPGIFCIETTFSPIRHDVADCNILEFAEIECLGRPDYGRWPVQNENTFAYLMNTDTNLPGNRGTPNYKEMTGRYAKKFDFTWINRCSMTISATQSGQTGLDLLFRPVDVTESNAEYAFKEYGSVHTGSSGADNGASKVNPAIDVTGKYRFYPQPFNC